MRPISTDPIKTQIEWVLARYGLPPEAVVDLYQIAFLTFDHVSAIMYQTHSQPGAGPSLTRT